MVVTTSRSEHPAAGDATASASTRGHDQRHRHDARAQQRAVAALLLLVAAVSLCALRLGDVRAYSGSDAGGKAATAKVMADRHTTDPDVGYWAAAVDPTGAHHPLVNTERHGDQWIQGTSVPFSIAESGLWRIGGPWAAMLLPVAGGVLAAYAAWRLARALGATERAARTALVLVGVVGPVGFYATDLWEHAPAVGLALFGTSLIIDEGLRPRGAVLAGLALGTGVVLRAEIAVHIGVLAAAVLAVGEMRRRLLRPGIVVAGIVGAAVPTLANRALESATIGAGLRGDRAGTLAGGAGHAIGQRLRDALLITGGPFADDRTAGLAAAAVLVVLALTMAAIGLGRWRPDARVVRVVGALVLSVYVGRLAQGPGFLPGMLAVAPVAVSGVVVASSRRLSAPRRVIGTVALVQLPAIWALQWSGNHTAQWGGRYVLLSGALLTVLGTVSLFERDTLPAYRRGVIALATVIGLFGLVWHVQRSSEIGRAFRRIDALSADSAIVSTDANALREGGAFYSYGDRWLRVDSIDQLTRAGGLADALALDDITLLTPIRDPADGLRPLPAGFRLAAEEVIAMPGDDLLARRLVRD